MPDRPETDALTDILRKMRLTAEIYARPDYCGSWGVDTSGHRKMAFHLIERGNAWLHMEDLDPIPMISGELVLFPKDAPHTLAHSADSPRTALINQPPPAKLDGPVTSLLCGFFEFQSPSAWALLDGLPDVVTLNLRDASNSPGTAALLQLVVAELAADRPGTQAVIDELAYVLFVHVLRSQMDAGLTGGLLCALADPKIGPALNQLHSDLAASWTVDKLAEAANMSRSAFAKQFHDLVGVAPMRYVTQWRITAAREMIKTTDLSIADIAYRVGYQSEAAFRKAFRRVVRETPGKVRRG
ncbi:MAG: AraC family transcriptional regulator [Pseudomonadota bacterium]